MSGLSRQLFPFAGAIIALAAWSGGSAGAGAPAAPPQLTRAFILQGMQTRDAIGLLRTNAQVRRIASIDNLTIVVVRDEINLVQRCESLLREKNAVSRVVNAPEPVGAEPVETRVLRVRGVDPRSVIPVLQAIYGMRDVKMASPPDGVTAQAPRGDLNAAEGLLRALGLLVEQSTPTGA